MQNDSHWLKACLLKQLEERPDAPAYRWGEATAQSVLSWREHIDRVLRLRQQLCAQFKDGARTLLVSIPNGYLFELAQQAAWLSGFAVIPGLPQGEIHDRSLWIELLKPAGLVVAEAPLETFSLPFLKLALENSSRTRSVRTLKSALEKLSAAPEEDALITFTSGSEGKPRALIFSYSQVGRALQTISRSYDSGLANSTVLSWLPVEHLFQRVINLCGVWWGAQIEFESRPDRILESVERVRPAVMIGVPRFFDKCAALLEEDHRGPEKIRLLEALQAAKVVITGSAPSAERTLRAFEAAKIPLFEAYGASECLLPIALNTFQAQRRGSVGRPPDGMEVRLSHEGEVLIRSACLARRRLHLAQGASSLCDDAGWYATGDKARLDHEGFIFLLGRLSGFVKTATGRKVELMPLEQTYREGQRVDHLQILAEGAPFLVGVVFLTNALETSKARQDFSSQLRAHVEQVHKSREEFLQVRHWILINRPLSRSRGELTASGKVRRSAVELLLHETLHELWRIGSTSCVAKRKSVEVVWF